MKKLIVTLVLVVGIVAAISAFEGMREHQGRDSQNCQGMNQKNIGMHHGMNGGFKMIMAELDLTDAQKEKFEDLKLKHQKNMIQLKADIEILKVDKQAAMRDQEFGVVKKLTGKIFDLKKDIALKQVEHHESMWNILTPEQQEKAKEMKQNNPHSKMMQHKKMMGDKKMSGMKDHKRMMFDTD